MDSDLLILVDPLDNPVGTCPKMEAHEQGLLHRAFSLFVTCEGSMLIQQRALSKYHSGGLWANACCSHPRMGEELADAVVRRCFEELGLAIEQPRELFSFVYRADFGTVSEYEFDHVFLAEINEDAAAALQPDPAEVAQVKWMVPAELLADLAANPQDYAAWFITAAPQVISLFQ